MAVVENTARRLGRIEVKRGKENYAAHFVNLRSNFSTVTGYCVFISQSTWLRPMPLYLGFI